MVVKPTYYRDYIDYLFNNGLHRLHEFSMSYFRADRLLRFSKKIFNGFLPVRA